MWIHSKSELDGLKLFANAPNTAATALDTDWSFLSIEAQIENCLGLDIDRGMNRFFGYHGIQRLVYCDHHLMQLFLSLVSFIFSLFN